MDKIKKYKGYIDMAQSKIKDEIDRFMEMIDIHRNGLRKASQNIEDADDISVIENIEDMASHDYKDLLEISKGYGEGKSKYNRMKFSHEEIYIKGSDWNPDPKFTEVARRQLKDTLEIYEALFKYIETRKREVSRKIEIKTEEEKNNGIAVKYEYSKVLNNYSFWVNLECDSKNGYKNIFRGISESDFISMINQANFSRINTSGITQRIKYNIFVLSRLLGKEWGETAAGNLGTNLRECGKMSSFAEFDEIKNMYLP